VAFFDIVNRKAISISGADRTAPGRGIVEVSMDTPFLPEMMKNDEE
jgi:hypothetical protein